MDITVKAPMNWNVYTQISPLGWKIFSNWLRSKIDIARDEKTDKRKREMKVKMMSILFTVHNSACNCVLFHNDLELSKLFIESQFDAPLFVCCLKLHSLASFCPVRSKEQKNYNLFTISFVLHTCVYVLFLCRSNAILCMITIVIVCNLHVIQSMSFK